MDIQPDSYRYVNWLLFFLAAIANSIPTQAFSGVSPIIKDVYQVSQFQANFQSLIYPISYIYMLLPANYIIDKKGLKVGTLICQICMIVGLALRLLINVNFYMFFVGTLVCSWGFCFMISGANKFANSWFPHHQIFLVSSVCVFGIFASDAIGTFFSSFFIRKDSTKQDIFTFFLYQSIILIVIHFLMAFFFRGAPKHYQNYASAAERNPFKQDLKSLVKNKNYRILFLSMTFVFGCISLVFVFLPWTLKTYNIDSVNNGYIFVAANFAGCAGCVIVSMLAKAFSYKRKCIILLTGQILMYGVIWGSFELDSPGLAVAGAAFFGLFCYPFLTTLIDFATQTTFPVGEGTASGILLFGGQFGGVILSVIFSFIFDGESMLLTRLLNIIIILLMVFGLISLFFAKEILKRQEYEDSKEKQSLLEPNENLTDSQIE